MRTPIVPFALAALLLPATLFIPSCQQPSASQQSPEVKHGPGGKDTFLVDPAHPNLPPFKQSPEFRTTVKKEPVAEYHEKTGHILGDFAVKLYQTPKTLNYLIDVEYEGLPGQDTLRLPDLGTEPQPVLQKGSTKYSCLIGFLDHDKVFRDVKLVYVTPKGDQFKIRKLNHWVVTNHYRLISQD
jgi:hypothetical protein